MFAPEGWISMRDVYEYFAWYFSEHDSLGEFTFTGDECYELTWRFANESKSLAVCTINGQAVPASRILVATENEFNHENNHINLHYGTVGTGEILSRETFPDSINDLEAYLVRIYGPFRNLPVVFLKRDFDEYLSDLAAGHHEDQNESRSDIELSNQPIVEAAEDMSPKAISERVLDMWRNDKSLTQTRIKVALAPQQSVRQFRFAWGLAAMKEPAISRPGRRKTKVRTL